MRTVLGYDNGRAIWSENVPASPGLLSVPRGELVVGVSGQTDRSEKQREWARAHKQRVAAGNRIMVGCHLDGHCLHHACMEKRRVAALQMKETGLNATEIGQRLDRSRTTVNDLIAGRWRTRLPERWHNRERCEAWMPLAKEPCARRKGHTNDHRTSASVTKDNEAARAA